MSQVETKTDHRLLVSSKEVDGRISDLAADAIEKYNGKNPLYVCFLKGGAPFATKLMFEIARQSAKNAQPLHPDLDYMTINTYGTGREAKQPRVVMDLAPDKHIEGRIVVMLDDVLDTGTTLAFAEQLFLQRGAKTVESAVLVEKENDRASYTRGADLVGFKSPAGLWLTGMGMDDAKTGHEHNRWTNRIQIVNPN